MKLFWKKHLRKRSFNLNTFRNTKKHNIFANWSPYSRGLTYHNFLINFFVNRDKKKFIKFKKSINNLNIGHPPHVLYDDKFFITQHRLLPGIGSCFITPCFYILVVPAMYR